MITIPWYSAVGNIVTTTNVRFIRNGYDDGKVELDEQVDIQPEDYHLDLTTRFQEYNFKPEKGKLIIKVNSPKIGGNYTIQVSPH